MNWTNLFLAYDAVYSDSKDLDIRTNSGNILKDRADESARNCGYDGYQRALASMIYKAFDKKTGSQTIATGKTRLSVEEQLAQELHKLVTKKFNRRKVYARFKGNISAADLTEIESLSSKNKNVKYLLCFIGFFH